MVMTFRARRPVLQLEIVETGQNWAHPLTWSPATHWIGAMAE